MTLVRFLLVRLAMGVLGLLVFASAIWLLSIWLIPGDFTSNFIGVNNEERDAIRAALGLDRPVLERYLEFVGGLLRLDLGTTFGVAFSGTVIESGEPVTDLVLGVLPWTMTLFALSIGLGFLIGLPVGRRVGWENRPASPTLMAAATATSIFPPWLALVIANVGLTIIGVTGYVRLRNLDDVMWDTPPAAETPPLSTRS